MYENVVRLKLKAQDGKLRETDTLDTKGILRLIESVPSPKAEPFKLWLANLGNDRIDEVFDPEKAFSRAIDYYLNKSYSLEWIEKRLKGVLSRKKLTNTWQEFGVDKPIEFAILTNDIYKEWSGISASEYKDFKNIRKENLRDNMTDLEVLLTDIGETATRELAKTYKPYGLSENKKIAKKGGTIAKITKESLEKELRRSVITEDNTLNYEYIDNKKLDNKKGLK